MADITEEIGGIHFPFPFTPYSIQKDFVAELYQVLEAGKIGMFESPTGTVSMNSGAQEGSWKTSITSSQRLIYPSRDFQGLKLSKVVLSVYFSEECSLPSTKSLNTPQGPRKIRLKANENLNGYRSIALKLSRFFRAYNCFDVDDVYTCHFIDPHTDTLRDTVLQRGKTCFQNLNIQPRSEFQIYMATGHLHLAPPTPPGQKLNASSSSLICPGFPVSVKDTLLLPLRCQKPWNHPGCSLPSCLSLLYLVCPQVPADLTCQRPSLLLPCQITLHSSTARPLTVL